MALDHDGDSDGALVGMDVQHASPRMDPGGSLKIHVAAKPIVRKTSTNWHTGILPAMQATDILRFWFTELTPAQHFAKDAALDATIHTRFNATLEAAARCELFATRPSSTTLDVTHTAIPFWAASPAPESWLS